MRSKVARDLLTIIKNKPTGMSAQVLPVPSLVSTAIKKSIPNIKVSMNKLVFMPEKVASIFVLKGI